MIEREKIINLRQKLEEKESRRFEKMKDNSAIRINYDQNVVGYLKIRLISVTLDQK